MFPLHLTDICIMPIDAGDCDGKKTMRYAYNSKKGKCVKFKYTGCGGNENNFKTKKECKKNCQASWYNFFSVVPIISLCWHFKCLLIVSMIAICIIKSIYVIQTHNNIFWLFFRVEHCSTGLNMDSSLMEIYQCLSPSSYVFGLYCVAQLFEQFIFGFLIMGWDEHSTGYEQILIFVRNFTSST